MNEGHFSVQGGCVSRWLHAGGMLKKVSTNVRDAIHSIHLEVVVSRSLLNVYGGLRLRKDKGFSLIELLIVVAIILIIAAIAIPNLMRSRIAANEASAVSSMRSINTAEIAYNATYSTIGYASTLPAMGPASGGCLSAGAATSANACLLDSVLSSGTKAGYTFALSGTSGTPVTVYASNADPVSPGTSGQRHFFSDATGVIRFNGTAIASSSDLPIQ
jgi:type IV pilus assembly protein PilA